jgi:CRISPR system Cascade subunit CasC
MSFFIETHIIQNIAPGNLNRDDTGAPKDAIFGGFRRARLSSQAQKRPVRKNFEDHEILRGALGVRTARLDRLLKASLHENGIVRADRFNEIVKLALKKKKKDKDKDNKSDKDESEAEKLSYLMFLAPDEVAKFTSLIGKYSDDLKKLSEQKAVKQKDIPKDFCDDLAACFRASGNAADIALFGRMLADLPGANQDAACQVAHSISTHAVERQFDYFTAVDDLATPEESGAAMIDNVEFNSATHYRYAALDPLKLLANLQGDEELALASVRAFIEAFACTLPSGKQNSFAAHNPPAFVGVVLRQKMPINLANAFEQPVFPQRDRALSALSVERLAHQEKTLAQAYGEEGPWAVLDLTGAWDAGGTAVVKLADLAEWAARQAAERYAARG